MRNDSKSLNVAAAGIMQVIDAAGSFGAPGGTLYAGLMSAGYSLAEFEQITAGLLAAGIAQKSGQCYTLTDKGAVLNARITAAIRAATEQRAA